MFSELYALAQDLNCQMIDHIAIIDYEQLYTNSEDFQNVTIDSKLEVICCLLELLNCLALESVWLAGIETFYRSSFNSHCH